MKLYKICVVLAMAACFLNVFVVNAEDDDDDDDDGFDDSDSWFDSDFFSDSEEPAATNASWYCQKGWFPYAEGDHVSCLSLSKKSMTFGDANKQCGEEDGALVIVETQQKNQFVSKKVLRKEGEFWIGLTKWLGYDVPFVWVYPIGTTVEADVTHLPQVIRDYVSYKSQCVYLSSYSEEWELDDCDSEYNFICEKGVKCKEGRFGERCEKECHCAGEPCDSSIAPYVCQYGCQLGWTGHSCDIKKQDPDVRYFCVNSEEPEGKYAYIRINTSSVKYNSIYGLDANNERSSWCDYTYMEQTLEAPYMTTIKIILNNRTLEQMEGGECAGENLYNNIYSWAVVIKENDGIYLEHDTIVHVTCDFNTAETLTRSEEFTIQGVPHSVGQMNIMADSTIEDVQLQVVSAYKKETLSEAYIGTSVILQMKYGMQEGSLVKGVFPYNCIATSSDGQSKKELIGPDGCNPGSSPIQPFEVSGEHEVSTPWFSLFAFESSQNVIFQCSFKLCFDEPCISVGCANTYTRKKRSAGEEEEEEEEDGRLETSTSTTRIRVLPSITPQRNSDPKPDYTGESSKNQRGNTSPSSSSYQVSPYFYLNPITCSLFLVLLVIFLCMYIAFLRTMRKSVNDIRREIEIKRSRDKFLNCGCAQKGEKEFVKVSP